MNFQNLPTILNADKYLETAFNRSKKISVKKNLDADKTRAIEFTKYLVNVLKKISIDFPNLDAVSEFYYELIDSVTDIDNLRKSLSRVTWASTKIKELRKEHAKEFQKKEFYGRVSSIMKRINPALKFIEASRSKMKRLPNIKEDLFTVCIVGFPNVGKSTLLSKITSSKPDIQNYAFTTKGLNTGYFVHRHQKIQVVDTPGTLARFDKMNNIEKQAYLAIKYIADLIIFVYDLTEEYPIDVQDKLLKIMKKYDKLMIFYLSKTDVLPLENINNFIKNRKESFITTPDGIKKEISERTNF